MTPRKDDKLQNDQINDPVNNSINWSGTRAAILKSPISARLRRLRGVWSNLKKRSNRGAFMRKIEIKMTGITDLKTDAIVNAANSGLWAGSGVCGAIFKAAGYDDLEKACKKIGHCDTGDAVITPGFASNAKYIIHAVGPQWSGGNHNEPGVFENVCERLV